ncbi:hypothetical protein L9F63_007045, partial [Diploptera punctata]
YRMNLAILGEGISHNLSVRLRLPSGRYESSRNHSYIFVMSLRETTKYLNIVGALNCTRTRT